MDDAPESHLQPGPAPGPTLQAQLYDATERLAIALVKRAEGDLLKADSNASVRDLQGAVEFAMNILVKLPKLKPEDADEDAGVAILQAAMTDPAKVVDRLQANPKFIAALRAVGWLPPPPNPPHRPNRSQAAERKEYAERRDTLGEPPADETEDDSVLKGMLATPGATQ